MKIVSMKCITKIRLFPILAFSLFSIIGCGSVSNEESPEAKKAGILLQQGTQDLISKNYTSALKNLLEAKKYAPDNDMIRNNLGMAYYLKNQNALAKTEFEKALSLNPKNSDARNNYASILVELKQLKQAKKEYQTILDDLTYQKMFRVYYNLGLIYSKENNYDAAKEMFEKSMADKNDYCPAKYQYGKLFSESHKFRDALTAFKEAIQGVCVNEPAPHFELGKTLAHLNRRPEAEIKFKEILEKFPKTPFANLAQEELNNIANEKRIEAKASNAIRTRSSDNNEIQTPSF